MEAKLTLKLDQGVISSAKKYAESNQKSLSKLVEDFLKVLVYENTPPPKHPQSKYPLLKHHPLKHPPLIKKLSGVISEDDLDKISREDEKVRYILREGR